MPYYQFVLRNFILQKMANSHLQLSSCIKNVHENLRKEIKHENADIVWQQHKKDINTRENYAQAMRELATTYWEQNNEVTRIEWVVGFCKEYFIDGKIMEVLEKENGRLQRNGYKINDSRDLRNVTENIKLLDAGSCYNPFKKFSSLFDDVLAIDLSPASKDVLQCDLLDLKILSSSTTLEESGSTISSLPESYFEVVVFSLLLEYLPSPKQRFECCKKASQLLQPNGLLFIITPDSKHQNRNSNMIKSWKTLMLHLNLVRVHYEKLKHLHCMAFRKSSRDIVRLLNCLDDASDEELHNMMFIPQDSNEYIEPDEVVERSVEEDELVKNSFRELPLL